MGEKVYLLFCEYHSEGGNIWGIFTNRELAELELSRLKKHHSFLKYEIKEINLDTVIDLDIGV
jgi:hypothetical protein